MLTKSADVTQQGESLQETQQLINHIFNSKTVIRIGAWNIHTYIRDSAKTKEKSQQTHTLYKQMDKDRKEL